MKNKYIIVIATIILFTCSSIRHGLYQSTAFDLGIFDQILYLISQGEPPIISFLNFHIMADHAAFIFYPISLLYKIYPDVHWLFAIQAIALSLGILPTFYLAIEAGLKRNVATTIAMVYILYPLVFNINLFDFHPDVIILPGLLWAILAVKVDNIWWFCSAIILVLSCKEVFSLTIAAMGFWLLFFEKKRLYASIAIIVGISWFIISTGFIIPFFDNETSGVGRHLSRYSHLGSSFLDIFKNLFLKPWLLLKAIFNLPNLEYLIWLFLPLIWGISYKHLAPLISAFPTLAINILSLSQPQKDLIHQYSLPILPFLILVIISSLAANDAWIRNRKTIIIWSLIAFLALAKYGYFWSRYLTELDTLVATREAVSLIKNQEGSVLTAAQIAPHLTHRPVIKLAIADKNYDLKEFDYVLLNLRHPGWSSSTEIVSDIIDKIEAIPNFKSLYQKDDIFLFQQTKKNSNS